MREWQATRARGAFSAIIDAAVDGTPQLIRRRDGKEVVVVSREHYEASRPNLRDFLLTGGYADDEDEFDLVMREARENGPAFLAPRPLDFEE
jgi:prevent-host-death family protein